MFSQFFIQRPIFASVISIVIVIAGIVTVFGLPIEQFPEITPPTVQVSAAYPGANAQVVAETVASPIEQQVNGVEGMIYMSSTSASDGSYSLTVTFEVGADLDLAQILVQNRVALAEANLPEEVVRQGVSTKKKSSNIILIASLYSEDNRYDELFLSNYATLQAVDTLSRIDGVGEVFVFPASNYAMRIWLDPSALKSRGLTTSEVVSAIREQNVQVAAGQIGQPPAPSGQSFQYAVNVLGRLSDVSQFENIIVKHGGDGGITYLRDISRIELGGKSYNITSRISGSPSASIAVYQLPGANALQVAQDVRAAMDELSTRFPEAMVYKVPYDTTIFVEKSIEEVYITLFQAAGLVFLVLFLFLQDWRATIIPAVAIPVSLIGTFAVMGVLGFSLNMLTLFGLVLAIGIVVDDSIVVVEATVAHIERGMKAREAAMQAMREVSGAVIATTLVLLAVFIPAAFLPGITGQMYRQFAITIAVATVFSSINALTMSPALAAMLLRPPKEKKGWFFRNFDSTFLKAENGYAWLTNKMVRMTAIVMLLFLGLGALTGWQFGKLPTAFLPIEDQGYLIASVQLPNAASLERTNAVLDKIDAIVAEIPGVENWVSLGGFSLIDGTNASNAATIFVTMKPWEERQTPELSQFAILGKLQTGLSGIQEAIAFAFPPPAIPGLGVSGGFQMQLQDRGDLGLVQLQQLAQEMVIDGAAQTGLTNLNTSFRADVPQLFAEVDRVKAKSLEVSLNEVFGTLQTYLGSAYVNDFNKFGRTWQVQVQADHQYRIEAEDIRRLDVRNAAGGMVPLGTLVKVDEILGPQTVVRYNLYPSATITGQAAPGFSSGQALTLMEQLADAKLPAAMGFEWTGISFQEKQVGSESIMVFALAILLVFLVLAAQYESWSSPAAVILVVPLALLGTIAALLARQFDNNVYTQIGIVLLIGLASKNAILIVEFARAEHAEGKSIVEAAASAAKLRFRPILMTAISSIAGFMPLVIAAGAGAASRQAIGTAVVGGMAAATIMSLLFTPVFYVVMQRLGEGLGRKKAAGEGAAAPTTKAP
ncbi:multidrug efflux RND transporter permease subunit [Pelagibius litoralis]|uniref:Efflux pump membrane transporter n=1 Tax=Pelagibius litoralis TaxID=374515 RepID=A0A967C2B4_9PROT|nr:multidrug efflux RND transporter permease subunit [Pelagibius litoralis]NIA69136.1 multidrug efflux RND transporter permease subunit [Pelagibius litoralis]